MAKSKRNPKKKKHTNPFKEEGELRDEITTFLNVHRTFIHTQATRISQYFEMCCFNYIVRFYENSGFILSVNGLQAKRYRYKISTSGIQSNFSYFKATKDVLIDGLPKTFEFEIQHNLAVQSMHTTDIYTTPDISVITANSVAEDDDYYPNSKRRFCFVPNDKVQTFCEAKNFNPFPELLFNFIGIVNELMQSVMSNSVVSNEPIHIAPSIMVSGKPSAQAEKIKRSLESRYCVNAIFDLFNNGLYTFSHMNITQLKTVSTKGLVSGGDPITDEGLPF